MGTLTVWKFDSPDGAEKALELLQTMQKQSLITWTSTCGSCGTGRDRRDRRDQRRVRTVTACNARHPVCTLLVIRPCSCAASTASRLLLTPSLV
jgi:hypothetical protein